MARDWKSRARGTFQRLDKSYEVASGAVKRKEIAKKKAWNRLSRDDKARFAEDKYEAVFSDALAVEWVYQGDNDSFLDRIRSYMKKAGGKYTLLPVKSFRFGSSRKIHVDLYSAGDDSGRAYFMGIPRNLKYDRQTNRWIERNAYTLDDLIKLHFLLSKAIEFMAERSASNTTVRDLLGEKAVISLYQGMRGPAYAFLRSKDGIEAHEETLTEKQMEDILKSIEVESAVVDGLTTAKEMREDVDKDR